MAKYHGRKGLVYLSTTGSGAAASVGQLNSWTLDMATDTVDTTCFTDANKTYVQGLKDIKGNLAGFWNDADDTLFTGADSADGVKMYLYPSSDAITKYWYGPAWFNASVEVRVDGAIKVSGTFAANGSWGRK
jgi:hypothetical protein